MSDVLGCDFSSIYIPNVSDAAAAQLVAQGFKHAAIGFDTSPASQLVQRALVGAGASWSAYRFLYAGIEPEPQVDNVVAACHAASELPVYLILDVEEDTHGRAPSTGQVSRAMDRVEQADIRPFGTLVKPVMYSAPWVWDAYYGDWDEPARRGWGLWAADWSAPPWKPRLFGGWPPEMLVGHQYAGSTPSAIGTIDLNRFRLPEAPTPAPPDQPPESGDADIPNAVRRINRAQDELEQALQNLRSDR